MNRTTTPIDKLEATLERLSARVPDLPVAGILLSRLLQNLGREMSAMLEQQIRPFGVTEVEFRVLSTLFAQPDGAAHPTDLCAKTFQSPANMSRISDALVARDLIRRVSSLKDRRKMVLHITEQGEALVRRLLPLLVAPLRDMFEEFSQDEQRELVDTLKRLGAKLDAAMARHAPSAERVE
jgi:MarR family transcriptional repressor of emrRAB